MIHPDKIGIEAEKKEDENFKFRSFLKGHADDEELDQQFLRLHKELFADYDCSKCRNCCKMYKGSIPEEDIEKDAEYLDITVGQFIDFFLEKEEWGITQSISLVTFCRKMVVVSWEIVSRIPVKNTHIQTSRNGYQVCWGC